MGSKITKITQQQQLPVELTVPTGKNNDNNDLLPLFKTIKSTLHYAQQFRFPSLACRVAYPQQYPSNNCSQNLPYNKPCVTPCARMKHRGDSSTPCAIFALLLATVQIKNKRVSRSPEDRQRLLSVAIINSNAPL